MTKQEIKAALNAKGILTQGRSSDPLWREAFDLYNKENRQKMNMNCGGCWSKVREWLQRN